ncbi:Mediator of RNA polymerase II transcription subunit 13 [Gossypium arboreum]|uniref:Mediator of RNA polymerase II transcription subunit 13 n=1 Tax=Gossypium arboreum TaxID=29729 RepID=A0A0B0P8Q6_GOSAR|nr:Mediator of RNA polymerase II transcription subunit 13 [Gossypium arboreum]
MSEIKNQRNQIWTEGKLKLSTSRPVLIFIIRGPCLGQRQRYEIAYFEI